VAEPLREHYSVVELMRVTPLFALIWLDGRSIGGGWASPTSSSARCCYKACELTLRRNPEFYKAQAIRLST
jgi:hypothetical protein